jgi:hypothetical protein
MVCFATAELESSRQVTYSVDAPVYKKNEKETDEWIEGIVSSFDASTNTYEILWSDLTIEYIDAETTDAFVRNEQSYDEYQFLQNGEEESLMQDQYEEHARITSEQQSYEVGTSVSIKIYDGTWMGGKIVKYDERGYTIEWDHGEMYIVSATGGGLDTMVEDAITQNSVPMDEATGYFPSEMVEPKDSSAMTTKESFVLLFSLVGILLVAGNMRYKKLGAHSSTKRSQDSIWRSTGKPGTNLSLEMDDERNLHSDRSII